MRRHRTTERVGWQKRVEEIGLVFHTVDGVPYWDEAVYYEFTSPEIAALETATNELHARCLDAVQHIIDEDRFSELKVSPRGRDLILRSWRDEPPSIYGRFDLAYDGSEPPKMLEYNADTPTSLLEAAVAQWYWLKDKFPDRDQFNDLHERLIAGWKDLAPSIPGGVVHFASTEDPEDVMTTAYMRDVADQAGLQTVQLNIEDIGYNAKLDEFGDLTDAAIRTCFKLYPWEWMENEKFGSHLLSTYKRTQWIEPAWKQVLSNKGILPILWELFPQHPNLLRTSFSPDSDSYVKKPLLSREGANVSIVVEGQKVAAGEDHGYGAEGYVFQEAGPVFRAGEVTSVVGSWVVQGIASGIGIRESTGPITDNLSRFVPHCFD